MKVKSLSSVQLFMTPWTAAYQAPPSMGFYREEYWSGLPLPSPFDTVDHNKLWKILKEMGISDHLTYLLRNLYVGQGTTEPNMEQLTGSKLRKEYNKAIYHHPAYLTSLQSNS